MNRKTQLTLMGGTILLGAFGIGRVTADTPQTEAQAFGARIMTLDAEAGPGAANAWPALYDEALSDPQKLHWMLVMIGEREARGRNAQVPLMMMQVKQNQEIIRLLRELNSRGRAPERP